MAFNIEIKTTLLKFEETFQHLQELTGGNPEIIQQEDMFFNVSQGYLKLRVLNSETGQLIYYNREFRKDPKLSEYYISCVSDPESMRGILKSIMGIRGMVCKTRYLFMIGRTRIHLDRVQDLGDFLELEVVLGDKSEQDGGLHEAKQLMNQLGISTDQLIKGAYIDLF